LCPSLTVQDCQLIFTAVDANGDGQISYTEFLGTTWNG
jgi:Ca2+-binding EF-hand superfamily protein